MARLSDLPLSIIEMILCLIPIQEAGRTSILSREWRYRWTKRPELVFEENTFQVSTLDGAESSVLKLEDLFPRKRHKKDTRSKFISAVGQVLLMHDGPLHEFTLSLLGQHVKIDHILTLLSRKTSLRKLELNFAYARYWLPSSISTRKLQHVLSSCPLLKTVILNIYHSYISGSNDGPTFTELLKCLPETETLSLSFDIINVFVYGRVPQELPTPLFHLKYLSIHHVCFSRHDELILAFLIKSSPNLEKLKILDNGGSRESSSLGVERYPRIKLESSSRGECYAGIMLEHLNELEIKDLMNHKTRFDFIKLILARSPVLKKVRINGRYNYIYEKFKILETLSGYSRSHVHHQRYKSLLTALSTTYNNNNNNNIPNPAEAGYGGGKRRQILPLLSRKPEICFPRTSGQSKITKRQAQGNKPKTKHRQPNNQTNPIYYL